MMKVPTPVLRDVFGNDDVRHILLLLAEEARPTAYNDVRSRLGPMHPETFRRSLKKLEGHGLVGRILRGPADADGMREAFLELTSIGRFWAQEWRDFEKRFIDRARKKKLSTALADGSSESSDD